MDLCKKATATEQNDVREGVAIMWKEDVDVSITGNSTNPTRFQHGSRYIQEGTYRTRKEILLLHQAVVQDALHPDNMAKRAWLMVQQIP